MIMMDLFNRNRDGSKELEDLTGQWYASSPFRLIETEIRFATDEVARLVSQEVVKEAAEAYDEDEKPELVAAVRLPVACLALMRYAKLSSVSHESTGRKVKIDDNERSPYEWQIDRDDRAMRERYFRALDALYTYLETSGNENWKTSAKRTMTGESIVRNIQEFEAVYPVDGSYYVYYLLQALVIERQRAVIGPFAGDKWASIADGSADERVLSLARRAAILSAVIVAGTRWSLEVFPVEIARRFSPTYQGNRSNRVATMDEIDWYVGNLKSEVKDALTDLSALISEDKADPKLLPVNDRRNKFFTTE